MAVHDVLGNIANPSIREYRLNTHKEKKSGKRANCGAPTLQRRDLVLLAECVKGVLLRLGGQDVAVICALVRTGEVACVWSRRAKETTRPSNFLPWGKLNTGTPTNNKTGNTRHGKRDAAVGERDGANP